MYVKMYEQLFNSSIMEQPLDIRYIWMCILTLADKEGYIDMTIPSIARRINISDNKVANAIDLFVAPDPSSRTPDHDGRRLEPIRESFGWRVINYIKYRDLRDQEARREYMRDYMKKRRTQNVKHVNTCKQSLAHTDTDTTTYKSAFFDLFWREYPKKKGKGAAESAWKKLKPDAKLQLRIMAALKSQKAGKDWLKDAGQFIPHPATWLNQHRWEDEVDVKLQAINPTCCICHKPSVKHNSIGGGVHWYCGEHNHNDLA